MFFPNKQNLEKEKRGHEIKRKTVQNSIRESSRRMDIIKIWIFVIFIYRYILIIYIYDQPLGNRCQQSPRIFSLCSVPPAARQKLEKQYYPSITLEGLKLNFVTWHQISRKRSEIEKLIPKLFDLFSFYFLSWLQRKF